MIERHHYHHPYSYYSSQPVVYVGNGYSSTFFWIMMLEWDAQRRADWAYHNRDRIEADAYRRLVADQDVQRRLATLEAQNVRRNASYVDPDFAEDPSLMYDQNYVEAVYNPTVREVPVVASVPRTQVVYRSGWHPMTTFLVIVVVVSGVVGVIYLITKVRFGE